MSLGSASGQGERQRKGEHDGYRFVECLEFSIDAALPMLIVGISALWSRTQDPITDCGLMAKSRNQLPKIFIIATELASPRRCHAVSRGFVYGDTAIPTRGLAKIPWQPAAVGLEDLP